MLELKLEQYEKVSQMFGKFFNQEALSNILDEKADIKKVEKKLEGKATVKDFQKCLKVIDSLFKRLH